jgi:hypothetical protein
MWLIRLVLQLHDVHPRYNQSFQPKQDNFRYHPWQNSSIRFRTGCNMEDNSKYRFQQSLRLHTIVNSVILMKEEEVEVVEEVVEVEDVVEEPIPLILSIRKPRCRWKLYCQ